MSQAPILTIKFVSDLFDESGGFELTYDFVDGANQCGGTFFSTTGIIKSPNWPNNYTKNLDCFWTINTAEGTQMELEIKYFDLEYKWNCTNDWLDIG